MEKSPICVDFWEFAWQSWHNICLEFCEGRTLNVELVVALRALSVALASETHTTHTQTHAKKQNKWKKRKKRPKRITKRTVTPVNPGVAMRLVMRLELQIGEIPLRFSGISLFGFPTPP